MPAAAPKTSPWLSGLRARTELGGISMYQLMKLAGAGRIRTQPATGPLVFHAADVAKLKAETETAGKE